tara:strand:- start:708 stop:1526 length:819 start_codon:yes stop_codon:yes gene_type:complete
MKPKIYSADPTTTIPNQYGFPLNLPCKGFKERGDNISICFDTFEYDPKSKFKVLVQLEPPAVRNIVQQVIDRQNEFDLILAWHPDILRNCSNAKILNFIGCWIDEDTFKSDKQDEVSFLLTSKTMTPGHRFRQDVYNVLKDYKGFNEFTFNCVRTPPYITSKQVMFENAKFAIVIENDFMDNLMSEKLIDCFVTNTIPIYCGCTNVHEFFDSKGIIPFKSVNELTAILNSLTPEDYSKREEAMRNNYELSEKHRNLFSSIDLQIDTLENNEF